MKTRSVLHTPLMSARRQPDFWDWTPEVSDRKDQESHIFYKNIADNYCKRKGNGCHKEDDQAEYDDEEHEVIVVEDVTICCCDTDL